MTMSALYGELGYTFMKVDAFGTSFRPNAIRGIIGYDVHPLFAIEGMLGGGVNDDSKNLPVNGISTHVTSKLDYMYGIWAKPKYMVAPQVELFGRVGWARTELKLEQTGFPTASSSHDDLAWGIGANYRITPNGYVGVDWMRYSNKSNSHTDGLTLSAGWHW
jgi:hypothetical protein